MSFGDNHIRLHKGPVDSTIAIYLKKTPRAQHAGKRKVRKRCFISFSADKLDHIMIRANGKEQLVWHPWGITVPTSEG